MPRPSLRVRFAPITINNTPPPEITETPENQTSINPKKYKKRPRQRSQTGCRECRTLRVKCDEAFPVCQRCQRRGLTCTPPVPLTKWQVEVPCMVSRLGQRSDQRLLQHWFEKTSQIMVIDRNNNPFSFELLRYLFEAPSLLHTIQSISAGHEHSFPPSGPVLALEERCKALEQLRHELAASRIGNVALFFTALLMGFSVWVSHDRADFGQEHLFAARTMLTHILESRQSSATLDEQTRCVVGSYLYWDLMTSFLVHPLEQLPLDGSGGSLIYEAIHKMGNSYHPIYGQGTGLVYQLSIIGRYVRQVFEYEMQDVFFEDEIENKLQSWNIPDNCEESLILLYEAFRNHGLVMLNCARRHVRYLEDTPADMVADLQIQIQQDARLVVSGLIQIPASSNCVALQSIPLLASGSELTEEDGLLRREVRERLLAIYSMIRVPALLWAIDLLDEIWVLRDCGIRTWWLEQMLQRGQRLLLG